MRTCLLSWCLFAVSAALSAAQTLTDAEVQTALAIGQAKQTRSVTTACLAAGGMGEVGYLVTLASNTGRIALQAERAQKNYEPYGLAQVTFDLRLPAVYVTVDPQDPQRRSASYATAQPITRVVLKSKADPAQVVPPATFGLEDVSWGNGFGGTFSGTRAVARFDAAAVHALKGDVDVAVVTPTGERRCKIAAKEWLKVVPQ